MSQVFSAGRLLRSASFQHLTGVSVAIFKKMLAELSGSWNEIPASKAKSGRPWETGGLEDHLLIMLIYYRCYVTQEFIGFFYNLDKSAICRAIQRIEKLAKPLFGVKREPRISRKEAEALIILNPAVEVALLVESPAAWSHEQRPRRDFGAPIG